MSTIVFTIAAICIALVCIALLCAALVGDRSRGRRRCPRCWYAMEQAAANVGESTRPCPECGRIIRAEQELLRTRRRWKLAIVALPLLAAAWVTYRAPVIQKEGWISQVPTWVLLEALPIGGRQDWAERELQTRLNSSLRSTGASSSVLSEADIAMIVRGVRKGTWFVRPADEGWKASYGALWKTLRGTYHLSDGKFKRFSGEDVSQALADALESMAELPPTVRVHTRARWPEGFGVLVQTKVEHLWPYGFDDDERLTWSCDLGETPKVNDFKRYTVLNLGGRKGRTVLTGSLEILRFRGYNRERSPTVVMVVPVNLEFDIGGSVDEILEPISSAVLDQSLATGAQFFVKEGMVQLTQPQGPMGVDFSGGVFAGVVEIICNDRVLHSCHFRCMSGSRSWTFGDCDGEGSQEERRMLKGEFDPDWFIRVRSDPAWSLYELDATRYWVGQFDVPLR